MDWMAELSGGLIPLGPILRIMGRAYSVFSEKQA